MLEIGYLLDGKFEVVKVLGSGGMGSVYLCRNRRLGNLWAVKEYAKDAVGYTAEPEILKNLNNPGIPRIVDIFDEGGKVYLVEDYIEGRTLESVVRDKGRMDVEEACGIAVKICNIIGYLHGQNPPIIYRDLKPSNIMVTPEGNVVLVDFGTCRIYKSGQEGDTILLGSRGFAAPEQYGAGQSCRQTDIYGLGATIYFMVFGHVPDVEQKLSGSNLDGIIQKAMAQKIEMRYGSVDELKADLVEILNGCLKTRVLNKTMVMREKIIPVPKNKMRKNIRRIAIGTLVFLILVFCGEYFILNMGKDAQSQKVSDTASKSGTEASSTPVQTTIEPTTVSTPTPPENLYIEGELDTDNPIVLNDIGRDIQEKKHKKDDYNPKDIFYKLDPKAEAGRFENKFTIDVSYFEIIGDRLNVYCTARNVTGHDVSILLKDAYISADGKEYAADSDTPIKVDSSAGEREIIIPFKGFKLYKGKTSIITNIMMEGSGDRSDIKLVVNIK